MGAQCFKDAHKVEKISERTFQLGEGPHWDDRVQALYFIDIFGNTIHKYDEATKTLTTTKLEGRPTFIVPVEGRLDQFLVGLEREFALLQWDGAEGNPAKVLKVLAEVDLLQKGNRLNDGKADPRGRIYAGTMGYEDAQFNLTKEAGTLYRLDSRGITALASGISISNGLCWDLKAKVMYYIDSPERKIRRYDYDVETGNISNMKYFFDFEKNKLLGSPDGCTIDTDGNLWVAVFGGSCVLNISSTGELLRKVPIPAKQVTSVTFGGANLDVLFVTTARLNIDGEQKHPCGCTFRVTGLGVQGHPSVNYKLSDCTGENFVRFSGDTRAHAAAQLFAWDAHARGVDVHLLAEPTKLVLCEGDKGDCDGRMPPAPHRSPLCRPAPRPPYRSGKPVTP